MKLVKYIIMFVLTNLFIGFLVTDSQDYLMTKYMFTNKIFLQLLSILLSYLNVMYVYHYMIEYSYIEVLSKIRIGKKIYLLYFTWIMISSLIYIFINVLMDIVFVSSVNAYLLLVNIGVLIVFSFVSLLIKRVDISIIITFLLYLSFRIFLFLL